MLSVPHAMSAWPAVVEPACGRSAGVLQTPGGTDQSTVDVAVLCGGGAKVPSSATTAACVGLAGSIAMAGLCWMFAMPRAVVSTSVGSPSAGADRSSTAAAPTMSTNTWVLRRIKSKGPARAVMIARCREREECAATINR